jgi:hypothetical protein
MNAPIKHKPKRMTAKRPPKKGQIRAEAVHVKRGETHEVGFKSLRVLLEQDGSSWVAQGIDIDYISYGKTIEEAQANFAEGLSLTVHEHLKMLNTIKYMLKVAPQHVFDEYLNADPASIKLFSTDLKISPVRAQDESVIQPEPKLQSERQSFPFTRLDFLQVERRAA